MKLNMISFFGALVVIIMLIPNILYAKKNKDIVYRYKSKWVLYLEQIGRYTSIIFMICPFRNRRIWLF